MTTKKHFATERDIFRIVTILNREFSDYDLTNMEIKIGLPSYKLRKLDEFLFKKFNPNMSVSKFVSQEEINMNLGEIKFVLYKNSDEEPEIKVDENGNEYMD